MAEAKLIYADFMKYDFEARLFSTCLGTHKDLAKYDITLENGLDLLFYNDDADDFGNEGNLVVQGIIQYDKTHERWVAVVDWDEIKKYIKIIYGRKRKIRITVNFKIHFVH